MTEIFKFETKVPTIESIGLYQALIEACASVTEQIINAYNAGYDSGYENGWSDAPDNLRMKNY